MTDQPITKKEQREQQRLEKDTKRAQMEREALVKKVLFGIVLVGIVVGIVVVVMMSAKNASDIVDKSPDPTVGPDSATVVIKEYADFQCPGCAATYPVVEDIIKEYGDKVRFVYNDFPLPQHEYGIDSAVAGQCAFDQNKFFEYHHLLYDTQNTWSVLGTREEAQDAFTNYAKQINLDMNAFASCVAGSSASDRVNEDIAEGKSLRVNSTPSFFVNGKIVNTTPFSQSLRKAIDEALGKSQDTGKTEDTKNAENANNAQ